MTDLQLIVAAFFVVGLTAFFFGEGLPIFLLLGWLTYQWVGDQQDRALAAVQACLVWSGSYVLYRVVDAALLLHRRLTWRRRVAEIEQVRAQFQRAGLDFDLEMANAGLRYAQRQWQKRCLGMED